MRCISQVLRTLCAGVLLAQCVSCSSDSGEELVIISPHPPEIRTEFTRGFDQWLRARNSPPVRLRWIDVGGTGEAIEYVRSRNTSGAQAGGVDVFFGGGDFPFVQLKKKNLLAAHAVPESILARIPRTINGIDVYQKDSLWYGAALSSFGIIVNREIARRNNLPVPQTWSDLASRECAGWVSSGDPRYSGSMHMMYEILLQAYGWRTGWEVMVQIAGNVQSFSKGAASAAKEVSTGQAAFGLAIDFYAFTEIQRYGADRLAFVLPENESVINADGIAVLTGASQPALAGLFIDYVLSEGQKLWVLRPGLPGGPTRFALCRFPVDSSLYNRPAEDLTVNRNPYHIRGGVAYDGALAGKRWSLVGDMTAAFIITPHEDLKRCWREIIRRGLSPASAAEHLRIEIDEQEALALAAEWNKPEFARKRIELMNEWTRWAKRRYRSVPSR